MKNGLYKLWWTFLRVVDHYITFPVLFHIIPLIILILLSSSCSSSVPKPKTGHTYFTLVDKKEITHQYNKPIIIQHGRRKVMYCRTHHRWEVIRSYWNTKEMDYEYYVIKHPKG